MDRTKQVTGRLTLATDRKRSRSAQAGAGGKDRLSTDDGGHSIAVRFNGPTDRFNHFAQNANLNRSGDRALEDRWANDVKRGRHVYLAIIPEYRGSSKRPDTIDVVFTVDGSHSKRSFPNTATGKMNIR